MVDGLAERLETSPDDLDGWLRLAHAYTVLNEPDNARAGLPLGRAASRGTLPPAIRVATSSRMRSRPPR